ncbi:MAG: hypothetical protein ACXADH_11870 [Candidatus Kariarchaeaceae archaeon]|jgi:phenylacetate-CoA ligase
MQLATEELCRCGRGRALLKEIRGRGVSVFTLPDGGRVHGWFFLYLFWEIGEVVKQYRVIQRDRNKVRIEIIPGKGYGIQVNEEIQKHVKNISADWEVEIDVVEEIPLTQSGKREFITSFVN